MKTLLSIVFILNQWLALFSGTAIYSLGRCDVQDYLHSFPWAISSGSGPLLWQHFWPSCSRQGIQMYRSSFQKGSGESARCKCCLYGLSNSVLALPFVHASGYAYWNITVEFDQMMINLTWNCGIGSSWNLQWSLSWAIHLSPYLQIRQCQVCMRPLLWSLSTYQKLQLYGQPGGLSICVLPRKCDVILSGLGALYPVVPVLCPS